MEAKILRCKEVLAIVRLGRTTLWKRVKDGQFPQPVKLGGPHSRAVGWRVEDVEAWLKGLDRPGLSPKTAARELPDTTAEPATSVGL